MKIKVAVNGAMGRMGREVVRAVCAEHDLHLVAAIDLNGKGEDAGTVAGIGEKGIPVTANLKETLLAASPDVLVDFTSPFGILENIETALSCRVRPVVGTTGINQADLDKIRSWSETYETPVIIAPNFAIGAVLMMVFSEIAARFMPSAEIIELHHDQKIDAPSGTAIKTAEMILKARGTPEQAVREELEKVKGARGGNLDGIHLHSVRLPGLVAHQEVIFGSTGQTLTIRHDSLDRTSFMPGVIMAVRAVMKQTGMVYGLEKLLKLV